MSREAMTNQGLDQKIFRNTAVQSKKINVVPMNMRGGIRL